MTVHLRVSDISVPFQCGSLRHVFRRAPSGSHAERERHPNGTRAARERRVGGTRCIAER